MIYPPVASLTAPYLSVPALSAFLKAKGADVTSIDLSILSFDRLLSRDFIAEAGVFCEQRYRELDSRDSLSLPQAEHYAKIARFVPRWEYLAENIDRVKACLRGKEQKATFGKFTAFEELIKQTLALVFIPFLESESLGLRSFETLQYLPLSHDILFSSDRLVEWVMSKESRFDRVYQELLDPHRSRGYGVVGLSVPYPDQLPQALRIARFFRDSPERPLLVLGGAYISRVMMGLKNSRLFDIVDAIILNDGEAPLWELIRSDEPERSLKRVPNALWRDGSGTVRHNPLRPAVPLSQLPAPDFSYIPFDAYLTDRDGIELPFLLSHGCYWKKCAFCNNQLSLVTDFHTQDVPAHILPKIRSLIDATGIHHFHFVDEAMPPATLVGLSQAVVETGLGITWRGNIRVEDFFSPSVCRLMAEAGCYRVMIGVESLNDDTLSEMKKGTTVEQIVRVVSDFSEAGIWVNAYMIYGWPRETRRHLANTLKVLRRLIATRRISSVVWHFFSLSPTAPMFRDPASCGIRDLVMDPAQDIPGYISEYGTIGDSVVGRDPASFNRVDQGIQRLVDRVSTPERKGRKEDFGRWLSDRSRPMDKAIVFPAAIAINEGNYSIAEITGQSGQGEISLQRKRQFRIMNVLTGAWLEFSEDVYRILEECRAASQRGESMRSAVEVLAGEWGMEGSQIEQAVLTVMPSLADLGISLSAKGIPRQE